MHMEIYGNTTTKIQLIYFDKTYHAVVEAGGGMRQPVFEGLWPDKLPIECIERGRVSILAAYYIVIHLQIWYHYPKWRINYGKITLAN